MPSIKPAEYSTSDATLAHVYNQLESIKNARGFNAKKELIKQFKGNEIFDKIIYFLMNPTIVTGLNRHKITKKVKEQNNYIIPSQLIGLLEYLTQHNTGKDEDIWAVQRYISHNIIYSDFIKDIATKSYKLGVFSKTIDQVYGEDFLNVWKVQQAYPIEKYGVPEGEWFSLSQKLNGFHASYYKGKLISRQGLEITGCDHIIDIIENQLNLKEWFIDGELIRKNTDKISDEENFRQTVSIANSNNIDKTQLQFIFYDIVPIPEFDNGESSATYKQRLKFMLHLNEHITKNITSKDFHMVDIFYMGCEQEKIKEWLAYADSHDMEGLMLNRDIPYFKTRHSGILKVKSWHHCDLKVIGVEEGTGKYYGTLGALIVDYKGNPLRLSGMSDLERDAFWLFPENIIGKIVLVKYKQETRDKAGKKSLQFATYQGIREDKTEPSYN